MSNARVDPMVPHQKTFYESQPPLYRADWWRWASEHQRERLADMAQTFKEADPMVLRARDAVLADAGIPIPGEKA